MRVIAVTNLVTERRSHAETRMILPVMFITTQDNIAFLSNGDVMGMKIVVTVEMKSVVKVGLLSDFFVFLIFFSILFFAIFVLFSIFY